MIVDIFALVDDAPLILKRPLLPYTPASYRIPIFAVYNPKAAGWPEYAYYNETDLIIAATLIGGRRFPYTADRIPAAGFYTIHVEDGASYVVIGFDLATLWMYEKIEIILTSNQVFSYYGSHDPDGDPNPPMLISVSDIKKKADALKFAKFSFESVKLSFIKEKQSIFLYGGEIVLSLRHKESETGITRDFPLGRFIMDKIAYNMTDAQIEGIDFRYRLNIKFPTDTFTREEFPFLQNDYIDIIKPVMLGIGNGIPGIPVNGLQIYSTFPEKITRYDFQFPPGWTNLYKVEVKQGDTWTEIYPGLGNPFFKEQYTVSNPYPINANALTGIVKVDYRQALQDGEYGNDPNEIRMYAKWGNSTTRQALEFLLSVSNDETLVSGFTGEFDNLAEIGLYMNSAESIFTWIEKLQAANILGGQLMLVDDLLYYRLENPNRQKKFDIPVTDVINHETLSVTIAENFMYSGWDITWKKAWSDNSDDSGHAVGVNYRYPTAPIYNGDDLTVKFIYPQENPAAQFFDTSTLQQRIKIMQGMVSSFRHKIADVEIPMTPDYLELLIYDVIGYLPKTLENNSRAVYDWMIYEKKLNFKKETISLTLVERIAPDNFL
jgi:hypothetical protein